MMVASWIIPTLIALFFFGLWAFFTKLALLYIDERSAYFFQALGVFCIGLITLSLMHFKLPSNWRGNSFALLSGLCTGVGCVAYFYAASRGKISTIVTITALYPIVTIILAYLLLHEYVHLRQAFGILLALIAIYLMT